MHTIKRAAELTGVPAATLRAWERRYDLVDPVRTDGGYRLYDDEALARIHAMAALVTEGWSASTAAAEVNQNLGTSALTSAAAPAATPTTAPPSPTGGPGALRLLDAAVAMDPEAAARILDERLALGSFEAVVDDWLMPTLEELGTAWADGRVSVAGEHLVAHAVLRRLAGAYEAAATPQGGPQVLVGLPAGAHHELGVFAFAVALRRRGVDVLYLGPDLPTSAWRAARARHAPRGVVLGVPRHEDADSAQDVLRALGEGGQGPSLFVGGHHQDEVATAGTTPLGHAIVPAAARVAHLLR